MLQLNNTTNILYQRNTDSKLVSRHTQRHLRKETAIVLIPHTISGMSTKYTQVTLHVGTTEPQAETDTLHPMSPVI